MGVWQFVQDQVLGMKWLNELIGSALSLLGLDITTPSESTSMYMASPFATIN